MRLVLIKGYVINLGKETPITWMSETPKFAKDVHKVIVENEKLVIDERVFDEKIPKKEIRLVEESDRTA
jgi:hypothetical protein